MKYKVLYSKFFKEDGSFIDEKAKLNHLLCMHLISKNAKEIRNVVKQGADINIDLMEMHEGHRVMKLNALQYAAMERDHWLLEVIISAGADVNIKDETNRSLLSNLISSHNYHDLHMAKILICQGAESTKEDKSQYTKLGLIMCSDATVTEAPALGSINSDLY